MLLCVVQININTNHEWADIYVYGIEFEEQIVVLTAHTFSMDASAYVRYSYIFSKQISINNLGLCQIANNAPHLPFYAPAASLCSLNHCSRISEQ